MKLGRRCIQVQCDLSDAISVGELIPRLLLSLDPPVHLAPTDRPISTTTTAATTTTTAKAVPHMITEKPQQAPGMPTIPNNDIHILINNAAILEVYPAEEYPMSSFSHIIQTNLSSPFQLCRDIGAYWLQEVLPTTGGRVSDRSIINVSSVLGYQGGTTVPAYSTSKGGLLQVTKALGNEWAAKGIRVNGIGPGACDTDMNYLARDSRAAATAQAKMYIERIPAKRWGTAEDFKGIAVFLASGKASGYITGETVMVDGGWMAS